MTVPRPCLGPPQRPGISRRRCTAYAIPGESRCAACKALFESARRADPNLTGRRGTDAEWRRARGLKLWRAEYSCEGCGVSQRLLEQRFKPESLEVHHVDGDARNNRQSNLRALCPSCHKKEQREVDRRNRPVGR